MKLSYVSQSEMYNHSFGSEGVNGDWVVFVMEKLKDVQTYVAKEN